LVAEASHVLCDHGYLRKGWCLDCDPPSSDENVLDASVLLGDDLAGWIAAGDQRVTVTNYLLAAVRRLRWLG
jgi:hypothetical protein